LLEKDFGIMGVTYLRGGVRELRVADWYSKKCAPIIDTILGLIHRILRLAPGRGNNLNTMGFGVLKGRGERGSYGAVPSRGRIFLIA